MIQIDSIDSLNLAASYCHDAQFEVDEISYDIERNAFSLYLKREMWERAKRGRFFFQLKIPKTDSILTFYEVVAVSQKCTEKSEFIEDIGYDTNQNIVSVQCLKGSIFWLKVNFIRGILEDKE